MATVHPPEISIIIPVLNEREALPELLANLTRQREVRFEVLISDAGSRDGTREKVDSLTSSLPYPLKLVNALPGRPRQLNAGAATALGATFLFLHADSSFAEPLALRQSLDALTTAAASNGERPVAGHFPLTFRRSSSEPSLGYYFYECKARLDRPECSHGDQGLLLGRQLFARLGPFPEEYPMLAETRMADRIRQEGRLLLLPAEIQTSARRFETEGLRERQTLNAMLMSCAAIGWTPFFRELPSLYLRHDRTGRLQLAPVCQKIRELLDRLPPDERRIFWQKTGEYVRDNAWQLAFALDVRRNFRKGLLPGAGPTTWLAFYDHSLDRLLRNRFGAALGSLLTRCWFARLRRKSPTTAARNKKRVEDT